MQITAARVERGELVLTVADPREAMRAAYTLKAGDYELVPKKKKRSLDANAYFWVLAGAIAASAGTSPEEVYRNYIRDIGGNYDVVPVREDVVAAWDKLWCSGHVGRMTEDAGPCKKTPGYRYIKVYIGSSDYDTAQMSRLIELALQDCRMLEIETRPEEEIKSLLEAWT